MQTTLHPVSREDALHLAAQSPLTDLLTAATELRARGKGTVITFSRKVFIPLPTLCRDYCSYCTFRKDPGQPGAHFMMPDEVIALAEQGRNAGCKEVLFSLGDQPERIFSEAREFLRKQGFAHTLDYLAAMSGLSLEKPGLACEGNPGFFNGAAVEGPRESKACVEHVLGEDIPPLTRDGSPHADAPGPVFARRL